MGRFLGVVETFFGGAGLKYRRLPDKPILALGMQGKSCAFECFVLEDEKQEQITIYTGIPNRVPEEARAKVAEYITRANWGLKNGNFEMDFSDGEIRYKTFIDVEGGQLTPKMVQTMFSAGVMTSDRYFPGLAKVMWAGVSPAAAIAEIEKG